MYDVTIAYEHRVARGWGTGFAYVYSLERGEWSREVSRHGLEDEASSLVVAGCTPGFDWYLDDYSVEANGEGGGAARLTYKAVDPVPFRDLWFEQIDLGATLEELFGVGLASAGALGAEPVPGCDDTVAQGSAAHHPARPRYEARRAVVAGLC